MENGPAIDVVLVEDNEIFRGALELLLELTPDIRVVASVGDGHSALEACKHVTPDVVLMDYRLPQLDGVETTAAIRASCSDAAVVVLTASADAEALEALLDAGAVACLTKDSELNDIVRAVREAAGRNAAVA